MMNHHDKKCNKLIPNTFIICGEGGNYCSNRCYNLSLVGKMTFEDFYLKYIERTSLEEFNNQRRGQLLFNTLEEYMPNVSAKIYHSLYDPTYNDYLIDSTLEILQRYWDAWNLE